MPLSMFVLPFLWCVLSASFQPVDLLMGLGLGVLAAIGMSPGVSWMLLQKGAQRWFVQAALLLVNLGTLTVFAKYAEIFSGPKAKNTRSLLQNR